ncbi:hypothetical protein CUMW_003680 [Citrus unshiu]|nr:hypothetical protein CUMW_003680 [Citrus unshiu]
MVKSDKSPLRRLNQGGTKVKKEEWGSLIMRGVAVFWRVLKIEGSGILRPPNYKGTCKRWRRRVVWVSLPVSDLALNLPAWSRHLTWLL